MVPDFKPEVYPANTPIHKPTAPVSVPVIPDYFPSN